jgi:hypothetical protein
MRHFNQLGFRQQVSVLRRQFIQDDAFSTTSSPENLLRKH